jgi:uncharacterized protein YutE (UPF0331/DUF86 family)
LKILDAELLAERRQTLDGHLAKVAEALPEGETSFHLDSPEGDRVVLHLFGAIQLVLDMAVFACLHFGTAAPSSYDDAIARLGHAGAIEEGLSDRLERTSALREAIVHAPEGLDAASIHRAAHVVPGDLRAFLDQIGAR